MSFGERLRKLRKSEDFTQKKLAKKIGVSRATIAGYETKGKEPSYETLDKLAEALNCSVDYLLGNTDERKPVDRVKEEYKQKYNATETEVQELFERFNVHLDGEVLTEEDKQSVINFLRMLRDRDKSKRS